MKTSNTSKVRAQGWPTAKCGHIVETKNSPCPACEREAYLIYWQSYYKGC